MTLKLKENAQYDAAGIGSALLDFTVNTDDKMLEALGLTRGQMYLIDGARSSEIFDILKGMPRDITPGGSSSNTIAGVTSYGGSALFMGRVGADEYGDTYVKATEDYGVASRIVMGNALTGHAITFITPDKERTFATHLGAALNFSADDVDEEAVRESRILHLEGYLFEPPALKEACMHAIQTAKDSGTLVSVDLSDAGLIERIKPVFLDLLAGYVDIVFANEEEGKAVSGEDEEGALDFLAERCPFAVVKTGGSGSIIKHGGNVHIIPSYKAEVINTNGAGDMYAAGVLAGLCRGMPVEMCGKLGSYGASLAVARSGARLAPGEEVVFHE